MELPIELLYQKLGWLIPTLLIILFGIGYYFPEPIKRFFSRVLPTAKEDAEVEKLNTENVRDSVNLLSEVAEKAGELFSVQLKQQEEIVQLKLEASRRDLDCDKKISKAISNSEEHCREEMDAMRTKFEGQIASIRKEVKNGNARPH